MDNNRYIYISDSEQIGDTNGTIVAGGNGEENRLDRLHYPTYIFVDRVYSVSVPDLYNHRAIKLKKYVEEGIVLAGGSRRRKQLGTVIESR